MGTIRNAIAKDRLLLENLKRGTDPNIPLMGSAVKRKRLSDITNIVSSSRVATSSSQFPENPKEVACGITKECAQLIEENANLRKALGETKKIIELSSIELQKLRFTLEKANQQNRMLTQTNSQMLAELTSSKERLKVLQHELGCTMAVLKLKNLALDEKEKLIKELSEKTRVEVECSNVNEVATDEDKLNDEPCVKTTKAEESYKCPKVTTGVSLSQYVNTTTWIPVTERTLRRKTLGSTTTTHHQAKEKPKEELSEKIRDEEESLNRELCEKNSAEDHLRCAEVASDVTRSHAVDSNVACESNKKRVLRSRNLGDVATMTHQAKTRDTDAIIKSSRRRSEDLASEAHDESKDTLYEILDAKIPACSVISELPNETLPDKDKASASGNHIIKARGKENKRKSSRRRSENLAFEAHESKDTLYEILDAKIPACSVISEIPNETLPDKDKASASVNHIITAAEKDNRRKKSSRRSEKLTFEPCESTTDLHETMHAEIPACPVISEPMNAVDAEEDTRSRNRKSSRMRSDNNLKPESLESNDQFPTKPALEPVAEPQTETSLTSQTNASLKHKVARAEKDQNASSRCEGDEPRRTSVGRPTRKAAEKVSSYKEVPLKVKMRRPE